MRRAGLVVSMLVLVSACSTDSDDSDHGSPGVGAKSVASLDITARHEVPMQVGNLVQKMVHAGATVEALCFASAAAGYPGPVAEVRSGETVGYVIVEVDGEPSFDLTAPELEARLPACRHVSLS